MDGSDDTASGITAMRLVFVIPYFYPAWQYGGQPRSCYELARILVRRGHHVKVLTTDSSGDTRLPARARPENVDGIEVFYYRNISNSLAFRQRIFLPAGFVGDLHRQLENCDLLHIHELRSTLTVPAYRAALRRKLPYVLSPHGGLPHLGKMFAKTAFDRFFGKAILRNASILAAVSPREEEEARAFGIDGSRIRLLPNTVFPEDYATLPPRGSFRSRWSIESKNLILFVGRLHWIKGADLLVQAFAQLQKEDSDCHLAIAGPDDGQEQELRAAVAAAGIGRHVTFTGFLNHQQKLEALVDSSVLVIPSRHEVFAIAALEGLMCDVPVLLSSSCGLAPMPGPEQGVHMFPSGDVGALALAFSTIGAVKDRPRSGRNFVSREFSPAAIGEKAEALYAAAIGENGRRNA